MINRYHKTVFPRVKLLIAVARSKIIYKDYHIMLNKDTIQAIVLKALNNINEERGPDEQIKIDLDSCLFGVDAVLDSLSLVSVIVDVEAAISERTGRDICLTDDRAMSQEISPFADVNTLTAYVELLLSEVA